jgi:HlyD family secretion protein
VQAEANLRAKESEYDRQKKTLEKLDEQVRKAKILAPADGLVVYATTGQFSWRGNTEPLAEGQEVREMQELIYLPTALSYLAELKIHESNLEKVSAGLPVVITVDALQGREFAGTVATIAPLPDAQAVWMNPDLKVYSTEVNFNEESRELRTGMSCRAEIVVRRFDDVVYVPVQAVLRSDGGHVVFVRKDGRAEKRPVEVGLDNNRMMIVTSGLSEDETVLLTPPLEAGARDEGAGAAPRPERRKRGAGA